MALARFCMLRPHLEEDVPLRIVAAEAGLTFRTAQRWVAQYRTSGLAALARKTRGDLGTRRVVSNTIKTAIEGLALESHPFPITSVHRQIMDFAQAIGEITPSYWARTQHCCHQPQGSGVFGGGSRTAEAQVLAKILSSATIQGTLVEAKHASQK